MQGRQFFGCFDGLLEFLLRRIHLGSDCLDLGIDRISDIGNSLLERPQRIPESFSQTLHIPRGHTGRLRRLRLHRHLLRLYTGHGVFIDNGRRTLQYWFCLSASGKRRVLCPHNRRRGSRSFFHRRRPLALPRRLGC